MAKLTVQDIDVTNKTVLVRVDFNVPLEEKAGEIFITDDTRIRETLPTLCYLREKRAKIILMSHLGRPKGRRDPRQSLAPVAERLSEILKCPVAFNRDDILDPTGLKNMQKEISELQPGEVLLLENVRFYPGEEKNDPELGSLYASLCEIYVNDAFGSAHRAHASTESVAQTTPLAVSGLLMQKELQFLGEELENPEKPFVVILGGAKVSDKIGVIERLLEKADTFLIGGGMSYTFAHAFGREIGNSLCEKDKLDVARVTLEKARQQGVFFLLPKDNFIVEKLDFTAKKVSPGKVIKSSEPIPSGWEGVDIGPETRELFSEHIAKAKTILWNGPMGVFEIPDCAKGTFAIAQAVAANPFAKSIIGGGDSSQAVKLAGVTDKITFISTGGGASLEFLEGKELPGVAALDNK